MTPFPNWNDEDDFDDEITLAEIFLLEKRTLTYWPHFKRRPKKYDTEQYICVLSGVERFRVVSPIFRENIYVGQFERTPITQTPVDFFEYSPMQWPLADEVNFLETTLESGDCLYVPAYFWVQSQTLSETTHQFSPSARSLILTHHYESHSELVDMMMNGLEQIVPLTAEDEWVEEMLASYLYDNL